MKFIFNKINLDKIAKIYLSIIGGTGVTYSIYNIYNAPFVYKQNCIDTHKYKNYKYDSNVEKPKLDIFIDKPTTISLSICVMEGLFTGFFKGMYIGALFPITIPSLIYCMKINTDLVELEKELEKVKPS